jgi:hypothetical protein
MNTISERAMQAASKPKPRDPTDRERLREEWRLASAAFILADDAYQRAKEGRQIFLDAIIGELMAADEKMKSTTAERMARTSRAYTDYLAKMHDMRRKAQEMKLEAENLDRRYWENVSHEANARAEMRMTGAAR